MAIWLRSDRLLRTEDGGSHGERRGGGHVGAHADVVPRAAFGTLMELDAAYEQLAADRDAARDEAAVIVAVAHAEAATIRETARAEYEHAAAHGYRDGEQRALADWVERLADVCAGQHRAQLKMRERIASIVTVAVEQIVQVQQADQLFERALSEVGRIVEGAAWLRVAVSPFDYDKACVAFERLCARWRDLGRPFPLSVVADKRLAPGSCLCESDFGAIDASLATQMRAMRLAVSRALKHSAGELSGLAPYVATAVVNATAPEDATADHHADASDGWNDEGRR
ncbi:HrpE/YscL family type III secretion apparatus protein [Paraburkholderia sp. UYCP14C]|uniref:type III secretion system stator protein SctL n=1 Tax=Paraburkholderia sp. UYCP14C TaxID=2511130 RepID=UPI001022869C|nr:type III secretion system stator protein SctL [Paraburkholderia sp. UYCP14C]RZF23573.1 HrpE/YscL family type III secretion apparatus protein [Paraburkholderia sp. UYCP14C]